MISRLKELFLKSKNASKQSEDVSKIDVPEQVKLPLTYSPQLHETWSAYQNLAARHEHRCIKLPDETVCYHAWDTTTHMFSIISFEHGLAEYQWDQERWIIHRCDNDYFMPLIQESIKKQYPLEKFTNLFSMKVTVKQEERDAFKQIQDEWTNAKWQASTLIVPHATWADFKIELRSLSPVFIEHTNGKPCALKRFYGDMFADWFRRIGNTTYYEQIPPHMTMLGSGYLVTVPPYFLKYPLQEWVKANAYYQTMPSEEYDIIFGNELPLTPYINEPMVYEEISLLN